MTKFSMAATGVRFCIACGTVIGAQVPPAPDVGDLSRICPYCGRIMSTKALFCSYCGRSTSIPDARGIQPSHAGSTGIVTLGRKFIGTGLVVTGLYFVWWGIYSFYYGSRTGWRGWEGLDYADLIFAFLAGFFIMLTGLVSFMKR